MFADMGLGHSVGQNRKQQDVLRYSVELRRPRKEFACNIYSCSVATYLVTYLFIIFSEKFFPSALVASTSVMLQLVHSVYRECGGILTLMKNIASFPAVGSFTSGMYVLAKYCDPCVGYRV